MMKTILFIMLFLWQLPQNILGLVLHFFCKKKAIIIHSKNNFQKIYFSNIIPEYIALGEYAFFSRKYIKSYIKKDFKSIYLSNCP